MSTLRVELPSTAEFKSDCFTPSPKLLLCGANGQDLQKLGLLKRAKVCAVDVQSAEELSIAVSQTTPDLIVLSLETLQKLFSKTPLPVNSTDDLERALWGLHDRQAEIVRMIAKGLRNREIASSLGLSSRTVKAILSSLYLRYDVTNRTELLGLLMEQGHLTAALLHPKLIPERGTQPSPRPAIVTKDRNSPST